ncbi:adenylyl-sulfate kinase [Acanthopleuribacter pedis]|uniref:Adenylyl-sulfate kinase n=1 Tax=Acanthopleuribacter pedis TaxID=442870 RepID=A0A8J7QA27_9BACT|nr:adenylyl-sulfate kinase [Acanthopleuribacter pedis]MBO1321556.1 adenylyl-sulfate kinase [Acanthopleuribacter pedis]
MSPSPVHDSWLRSLLKTLSWRLTATLTTIALVYWITGEVSLAVAAGSLELFLKMVLYLGHERLWDRLSLGRVTRKPAVLWFTGLSGAGKSTLALAVKEALEQQNTAVAWLDGDITRKFLPRTGFSREARDGNVLKAGFIARTLEENGVTVVASYISPYRATRDQVRTMCDHFVEIHVATPLEICEARDVKGLYAKARAGEISQFTGIDDPYEAPHQAEIVIDTTREDVPAAVARILAYLRNPPKAPMITPTPVKTTAAALLSNPVAPGKE